MVWQELLVPLLVVWIELVVDVEIEVPPGVVTEIEVVVSIVVVGDGFVVGPGGFDRFNMIQKGSQKISAHFSFCILQTSLRIKTTNSWKTITLVLEAYTP